MFRNKTKPVVQRTKFQFRVYNKTLNKKKAEERSTERKSAEEDKEEEEEEKHQTNKIYGEHTIRPVALVGGVGVRPRRF